MNLLSFEERANIQKLNPVQTRVTCDQDRHRPRLSDYALRANLGVVVINGLDCLVVQRRSPWTTIMTTFLWFKRNGENVDAFGTVDSLHFELSEMIGYSDC